MAGIEVVYEINGLSYRQESDFEIQRNAQANARPREIEEEERRRAAELGARLLPRDT